MTCTSSHKGQANRVKNYLLFSVPNPWILILAILVQEILFTGDSQNYCICFIDKVDSTKNTFILDEEILFVLEWI
jgi:hypothetical protein